MLAEACFRDVDKILSHYKIKSLDIGLTNAQAENNLRLHGSNEIPAKAGTSYWDLILEQFDDLLVKILLGAAVVSLGLGFFESEGGWFEILVEPTVIMLILIANAIVGVYQESSAEEAIEKLKEYEAQVATVRRDGKWETIEKVNVAVGDVIKLNRGDKVPADCRVVRLISQTISINQSALTGESVTVRKHVDPIPYEAHTTLQDKKNTCFSGTLVASGSCIAVACMTGTSTEIGSISLSLSEDDDKKTPLQEKLDEFAELLSKVILGICIVVWAININHFAEPEHGGLLKGCIYYFKIAVALAVAAIPEGLPAVVTTCLALGTRKMAQQNAIVRSLPSVETLGCTTVICSDKTGTLTTNQMCVKKIVTFGQSNAIEFDVGGEDFSPFGQVVYQNQFLKKPLEKFATLLELAKVASLCNEAELQCDAGTNKYKIKGSPTEGAIKVMVEKLHGSTSIDEGDRYWRELFHREQLLEFTSKRKSMSTVERNVHDQSTCLCVKGAAEKIVDRSSRILVEGGGVQVMDRNTRDYIREQARHLSSRGLRVLAFAVKDGEFNIHGLDTSQFEAIENDLMFIGLVGMMDPPRPEVKEAIKKCHTAQIRVIVITGDNKITAEAICRQIGVFSAHEDLTGQSFTGSEFMSLSDAEKEDAITHASLFSRVEPLHKKVIVDRLQARGEVVAMTGDGVNDAPALKQADIGIAMGTGTAVAKEASDMVLADDNFATIVKAVKEGRAIYQNTKQFIRYLISSNIGEVACIFFTAFAGMPEALIPVQLLWVNLVTDGLPATALGFNKPDPDIMLTPPRGRSEKIINGWMFFRYMIIGIYIGLATVFGFVYWYLYHEDGPHVTYEQLTHFHMCDDDVQSEYSSKLYGDMDCAIFHNPIPCTISLSILVAIEMFNTFNALSENQSLLVVPPWDNIYVGLAVTLSMALHCLILYNDFLVGIFHTAPLNWEEWKIVLYFSFPVIILDEVLKIFSRQLDTRKKDIADKKKD